MTVLDCEHPLTVACQIGMGAFRKGEIPTETLCRRVFLRRMSHQKLMRAFIGFNPHLSNCTKNGIEKSVDSTWANVSRSVYFARRTPTAISRSTLPGGVTVARVTLTHLVKVRILSGQFSTTPIENTTCIDGKTRDFKWLQCHGTCMRR